jgi:putative spermidine/putrescine transport system ATP-binding protein
MAAILLHKLLKRYGTVLSVDRLSLDVTQGELVALVGPSGCGKTTTLRMIAGLTDVTEGTIHFDSRDVTHLPTYQRNTGLVFQGYALFPHMTAYQNVAFGLEMRNVARSDMDRLIRDALNLVRMDTLADRLPRELSGGQQQRVALARAIAFKPDVLLLDEPLSALDAKLRHEVRTEIRRLQKSLGLTTILVTHDQDEAVSVADRIVIMNRGQIEQIGSPLEVYERPMTKFVADFIGTSSFISGRVESPGMFRTASGDLLRFEHYPVGAGADTLAIRPEKIALGDSVSADFSNRMSGTIDGVSYLGSVTEIMVRLPSGEKVTAHVQNRSGDELQRLRAGAPVALSWRPDAGVVL